MRGLFVAIALVGILAGYWFFSSDSGARPSAAERAAAASAAASRSALAVEGAPSGAIDASDGVSLPTLEDLRERVDRAGLERLEQHLLQRVGEAPDDGELHVQLCEVSRLTGRLEDAIAFGERAIELRPDDSSAHLQYAKALGEKMLTAGLMFAMSHLGTYKDELAKAVELDAANVIARAEQIGFFIFAPGIVGGDIDEAKRLAAGLRADAPKRARLMEALAAAKDEEVEQAIAICRAGLAEDPADQDLHVTLATFLVDEDRHDEAAPHFEAAVDGPPTTSYYRALYQHARMRVRRRVELEEAIASFGEYIAARPYGDMMPSVAGAHVRRGEAHALLGRTDDARAEYERALVLDPDSEDAREALDELD